jgi:hypothetical protein
LYWRKIVLYWRKIDFVLAQNDFVSAQNSFVLAQNDFELRRGCDYHHPKPFVFNTRNVARSGFTCSHHDLPQAPP